MSNTRSQLLLLHGVTMSAKTWNGVMPLLQDSFDLIVPTAAGHRGGPDLRGRASISRLTDDAEVLLDERGIQSVHVAGNSMGGWIAIELARRGRARSVCAFSPAGFWTPGARDHGASRSRLQRMRWLARATRPVAPQLFRFALGRRLAMRDAAAHADQISREQAEGAFLDLVECQAADDLLGTTEFAAPLDPLPCPITVAWSARDRIFPPDVNGAIAKVRLPGARFVLLPDVGHVPMIDDPALCAATITDSIDRANSP